MKLRSAQTIMDEQATGRTLIPWGGKAWHVGDIKRSVEVAQREALEAAVLVLPTDLDESARRRIAQRIRDLLPAG